MTSLSGGRINQKLRTRNALVEAASQLMREGKDFGVADVADFAKVGRTTAYRYFPSVETLIAHAGLHAIADVERRSIDSMLDRASDPDERLRTMIQAADQSVSDHDNLFRAVLRLSLTGEEAQADVLPRRAGVRRGLLESAIGPLRKQLGKKLYDRLTAALSLLVGIEGTVVLRDVCQLSPDKARDVKLWAASALLSAAIQQAGAAADRAEDSASANDVKPPRR